MRLRSTPESVQTGEPSALALLETLAAMGLYIWLGVYFDTWSHVAIAALLAPFMLLRTDHSVNCGWSLAENLDRVIGSGLSVPWRIAIGGWILAASVLVNVFVSSSEYGLAESAYFLIAWSLAFLFMLSCLPAFLGRLAGAAVGFYDAPLSSLREIPNNWWRIVGCTDFFRSPEIIPHPAGVKPEMGAKLMEADQTSPRTLYHAWGAISAMVAQAKHRRDVEKSNRVLVALHALHECIVILPIVIVGLAFRLSLKSTAIVWLPVLWAAKPVKPANEAWPASFRVMARDDLMYIVAFLSGLNIVLFFVKFLALVAEHRLVMTAQAWHGWLGERLGELAVAFVRPGELPLWQIASTVNAVLALILFRRLRLWVLRDAEGLEEPEGDVERFMTSIFFFRRILSSYTIVNQAVVICLLARSLPIPIVGSKFFPWL